MAVTTRTNPYAGTFVANNKVCTQTPFTARCLKEFAEARAVVATRCRGGGISQDDPTCAVAKPSICRVTNDYDTRQFKAEEDYVDPFAPLCNDDGTADSIREVKALRKTACLADDTENPLCPAIITAEGVNTDIWTARAVKNDGTKLTIRETIERVYDTVNPENDRTTEFWVIDMPEDEAFVLADEKTKIGELANLQTPDFNQLTLADTYYNATDTQIDLGGDDTDGAIAFRAEWRVGASTTIKHFAGILPTTNLGAPLVALNEAGAVTTATWHGAVSLDRGVNRYRSHDLVLTINFASDIRTITSPRTNLSATGFSGSTLGTLRITARFDEYGLITGTTDLRLGSSRTDYTGTLTGLIGEQGVVGAFISDSTSTEDYAGVFVANGNVCKNNPFDPICGADFNDKREEIVNKCDGLAILPEDKEDCAKAAPFICHLNGTYATEFAAFGNYANPFAVLCDGDGTPAALEAAALLQQEACLAKTEDSEGKDCPTIILDGGVSANIWRYTATKDDGTPLLRDTIERVYPENDNSVEFWGAGQEIDTTVFRREFDTIELDLADGGGDDLQGGAGDGAGYTSVLWSNSNAIENVSKKFAWILPTTSLGAGCAHLQR